MGKTYGYVRVSTVDQNEDRQLIALRDFGVDQIFRDKMSGKDFNRPQYLSMVRRLREGDLLVVTSIDRLGRNYKDIQQQWQILTRDRKIDIVVLDMPLLDTRKHKDLMGTFIADLVLQVLSFVAHTEREYIRKRQAEGIAAALARGVHFGRKEKPLPENFDSVHELWVAKEISGAEAARRCGMPLSTFFFKARRYSRTE